MKKLNYIIYIVVFLFVGEAVVRIDMSYDPLNNSPQKISVEIETSRVKYLVEKNEFLISDDQYRVLVLGDSYIHGGGVDPAKKTSKVLERQLKAENYLNKEIIILDVSRPSNNTLDNYSSFSYYVDKFQPNLVVLGYNFNDILGDLELSVQVEVTPESVTNDDEEFTLVSKTPPKRNALKVNSLKSFTKKAYRISKLLEYLSSKIQKELKLKGIVLPFGEFYFLTNKAYLPEYKNLQDTYKIFDKMRSKCLSLNADLLIYKMPEFNLLKKEELFNQVDTALNSYFDQNKKVIYINGSLHFDKELSNQYMLSKYDGHPNTEAHQEIAKTIFETLKNN